MCAKFLLNVLTYVSVFMKGIIEKTYRAYLFSYWMLHTTKVRGMSHSFFVLYLGFAIEPTAMSGLCIFTGTKIKDFPQNTGFPM